MPITAALAHELRAARARSRPARRAATRPPRRATGRRARRCPRSAHAACAGSAARSAPRLAGLGPASAERPAGGARPSAAADRPARNSSRATQQRDSAGRPVARLLDRRQHPPRPAEAQREADRRGHRRRPDRPTVSPRGQRAPPASVCAPASRGHAVARPPSANGVGASPPARIRRGDPRCWPARTTRRARGSASSAPGGAQPASTRTCQSVVAATARCAVATSAPGCTQRPYALPASRASASSSEADGGERARLVAARAGARAGGARARCPRPSPASAAGSPHARQHLGDELLDAPASRIPRMRSTSRAASARTASRCVRACARPLRAHATRSASARRARLARGSRRTRARPARGAPAPCSRPRSSIARACASTCSSGSSTGASSASTSSPDAGTPSASPGRPGGASRRRKRSRKPGKRGTAGPYATRRRGCRESAQTRNTGESRASRRCGIDRSLAAARAGGIGAVTDPRCSEIRIRVFSSSPRRSVRFP